LGETGEGLSLYEVTEGARQQGEAHEDHALGVALEGAAGEEEHEEQGPQGPPPMAGTMGAGGLGHGVGEEERQGVEGEELQVEPHRGVLGEEHEEEHDAGQAAEEHEREVEAPVEGAPDALEDEDERREGEQEDGARARTQGEVALHGLHAGLHDGELIDDHGRLVALVVGDEHLVEVGHEVGGQELLLGVGGGAVGPESQEDVVAEARPGVVLVARMDHLPEGALLGVALAYDLVPGVFQVAEDDVAGARGAVVVEVVVAIDAVLGQIVLLESSHDAPLLVGIEVDHLLGDLASVGAILLAEEGEGGDAHLIVGEPEDEAQHEVGLVEIEDAIVDGHVDAPCGILVAQGGMAVETIDFLVGRTGEEADSDAVHLVGPAPGHGDEKERKGQKQRPVNACKTFHDAKITYIIHIACLYFEFFQ